MATRKQKKIQLTIKMDDSSSYLPEWGIRQALREIIQNAKDSEVEFNAPMTLEWYVGSTGRETLRITNEGCSISKDALLFGHTTKYGRAELIGKFGEGLKLALAVFAREGLNVRVFTSNDEEGIGEIWVPEIELSETFKAKVLAITIKEAQYRKRVRVEIEGLERNLWDQYSKDYLFLPGTDRGKIIQVPSGEILLDPLYGGKIYVKGIFVEAKQTMWGYNFYNAELDRDRKMVDSWSYESNRAKIINEAINLDKIDVAEILGMMEVGSEDMRGYYFYDYIDTNSSEKLKNKFLLKHGNNSFPVANDGQAMQLAHLDPEAKAVVVPDSLIKILNKAFGSFEDRKKHLENEIVKVYDIRELNDKEIKSLAWSVGAVNLALNVLGIDKMSLAGITVCDFRSSNLQGQFHSENNQISIMKKALSDRNLTLEILVHEVAHRFGKDAEHSHVNAIEKIWATLIGELTKHVEVA